MAEVITLGEPLVVWIPEQTGDFTCVNAFTKGIAGAELNVAVGVSRLGHTISYVSRLGDDVFGQYILDEMNRQGIGISHIQKDPDYLTGSYFKTKVLTGDPKVSYMRKNSAASHLGPEDLETVDFKNAKILHLTGISAALSDSCIAAEKLAIDKAGKNHLTVTFDPNIRPSLWKDEQTMIRTLNELAFSCDIVMPGIAEGEKLTGKNNAEDIAMFYLEQEVKAVIVKAGAKGAYLRTAERKAFIEGFKVDKVVDTVGAGDAFATGVITGLVEGMTLEEAVRRGNAMGAIAVTTIGDNDAMPDKNTLESFMNRRANRI